MSDMSRSKQKRMEQEKARSAQHRRKAVATFWKIFIPLLIVAAIAGGVILYQRSKLDYSRYLNDNGSIKGVKASDYVTVNDENISFSKSELTPTDEEIDSQISSDLSSHQYVSDDPEEESAYGDKLSITYTSTVNGEDFQNAPEASDYEIGSEKFGEEFDEALEGHFPGDDIEVSVILPDDYEDENFAGKAADFNIHLIGVYVDRDFDDDYVKEFHSDVASTADEYRQSLIDKGYDTNLKNKLESSLSVNSVVSKIPTAYKDNLTRVLEDQQRNYMLSMYQMFGMQAPQGDMWQLMGAASKEEYDAQMSSQAEEATKLSLEIQYLYDKYGLSFTDDEMRDYYKTQNNYDDASFDEAVKNNGKGFYAQQYMKEVVINKLKEIVKITE